MNLSEVKTFIRKLKSCNLSPRQYKTLKGQALAGDLDGAMKGLQTILNKRKEI